METDTEQKAKIAGAYLQELFECAARDTNAAVAENKISTVAIHFDELRTAVKALAEKVTALQKHVDVISQEILPTIFENAGAKTQTVIGLGRVTINVKWHASMTNKDRALAWLRQTGNDGLIIETVNAARLTAWAKEEVNEGRPPPDDIFNVGTSNYTSITAV